CLSFVAGQMTGFTVDKICVLVYDVSLKEAYEVCYYPTILPSVDCSKYQYFQDTLAVPNTNCNFPAEACLPVPFQNIFSYAILDNGLAYSGPLMGCNFDTLFGYSLSNVPVVGPFTLNSWVVNSQVHGGSFPSLDFLPTLMKQIDPDGDWRLVGDLLLGGTTANQYGPIIMTTPQGVRVLNPGDQVFPRNSILRLSTGEHQLVFRHIATGCTDTASVKVVCYECPPVVDYPSTIGNDIVWTTERCDADTVFCTTIPISQLTDYTITIGGSVPAELFPCGNFVGFRLDTGYHAIYIRHKVSTCEYFTDFYFRCEKVTISDTALVTVLVGQNGLYCLDTTRIAGPIVSVSNDCPQGSNGNAASSIDLGTKCVALIGNVPGQDTLCLRICNAAGECALTRLVVRVVEKADTLVAVPDRVSTLRDYQVEISALGNDRYTPPISMSIVTPPRFGTATLNAATGKISYTPETGKCGTDSLLYRITTQDGLSSQAWVFVDVSCDPVLVYNGISPNGDGANDTWTILGIDQYPSSTVRVFNRWGNLVLERQGYDNNAGWDGTWNGQDLPDGPYFYLIELGGAGGKVSGYLQIHR
ncbi:MAG TPA: gliding motility-associated C-terminal domain-containing protein, partial [Saprospiraceae bacterium]|nr:gliding motility-associated C-terminal domain-containing protein [Saprospiraceae bacterium]